MPTFRVVAKSDDTDRKLRAAAEKAAVEVEEGDREQFVEDYVQTFGPLNRLVDERLERLEGAVGEVLQAVVPTWPPLVAKAARTQVMTVRKLTRDLVAALVHLDYPPARVLSAEALQEIAGFCKDSLAGAQQRAEARAGVQLD